MKFMHALAWIVAIATVVTLLSIFTAAPADDPYAAYRARLAELATVTPPPAGSPLETAGLERFVGYVTRLSADTIRRDTTLVYSDDALLCDTLAIVRGNEAIAAYFLKSAEAGADVTVTIDDIVRSGDDHYVRWTMLISAPALRDGAPLSSTGMTHVRLDTDGRVALHFDYWDSGHGFFGHVPGVRGVLARIRERLH